MIDNISIIYTGHLCSSKQKNRGGVRENTAWGGEDMNENTKQTNAGRLPSLNEHIETMIVNLSKNVFFFPFFK